MPGPLTWATLFTAWTPAPLALLVTLLLGSGYAFGLRRYRALHGRWPVRRTVAWFAGLATHLLVTCSFLGVYGQALFWVRAVQNVTSMMITPFLFALGAPVTMLLAVAPERLAARLRRAGRSGVARTLTFPLIITVVLTAPLLCLYLTPAYGFTLEHPALGEPTLLVLVACGFVYYWTRLQLDPTPRRDPHIVSFGISLTEAIADGALGLVVWLGPLIAANYYAQRTWGPDVRLDQVIGAGVLWIGGDLVGVPFVAALLTSWMRDDRKQAEEIDRELDAQDAARAAAEPYDETPVRTSTLWWENDPELARRIRREQPPEAPG